MGGRRIVAVLFVVLIAVSVTVTPALAQEEGEEGEGGIEGVIEGFIEAQGTIGALIVLLGGIVLLTACTEKLISYLSRASLDLNMSLFALAIIFTGFEFDDTILALVFSAGDLEGAALGTALGTGLAITGITLAAAAIVRPFPVDLPIDYIAIFALSPLVLVPFVLLGTLTFIHGVILTTFFVFAFGYFLLRERQRDIPVFRNTEFGQELEELRADGGMANPPRSKTSPKTGFSESGLTPALYGSSSPSSRLSALSLRRCCSKEGPKS
jgi:cation:H+ antiporter